MTQGRRSGADKGIEIALRRLHRALADAHQNLDVKSNGGRKAAIMALIGVVEFIDSVDDLRGLATPLSNLVAALIDIDRGSPNKMLERARERSGRPRQTMNRSIVKAAAAATMSILIDSGLRREIAAKKVADVLSREGAALDGRRNLDWRSVANWRDQLNTEITRSTKKEDWGAKIVYRSLIELDEAASAERKGHIDNADRRRLALAAVSQIFAQKGGS